MACEARMQKWVSSFISAVCLIRFAWPMKTSDLPATISEIRSRSGLMGIVVDSFTWSMHESLAGYAWAIPTNRFCSGLTKQDFFDLYDADEEREIGSSYPPDL